jgi:hypothetical protein
MPVQRACPREMTWFLLATIAFVPASSVRGTPPDGQRAEAKSDESLQSRALWSTIAARFPDDTAVMQLVSGVVPLQDVDESISLVDPIADSGSTFVPAIPKPRDPANRAMTIEIDSQVGVALLHSGAISLLWRTMQALDAERLIAGRLIVAAAWGRRKAAAHRADGVRNEPDEFCEVAFVHELPVEIANQLSKCAQVGVSGGRSIVCVQNVDAFNGLLAPRDVYASFDERGIICALSLTTLESMLSVDTSGMARGPLAKLQPAWKQCDWTSDCILVRRELKAPGDGIERGLFLGMSRARDKLPVLDLVRCRRETIGYVQEICAAIGRCDELAVESGTNRFTIRRMGTIPALLLFGLVREGETELGPVP